MIREVALKILRDYVLHFLHRLEEVLDPCYAQRVAKYEQRKKEVAALEEQALQEVREIEGRLTAAQIERGRLHEELAAEQAAIVQANIELRRIQDEKSENLRRVRDLSDHDAVRSSDL